MRSTEIPADKPSDAGSGTRSAAVLRAFFLVIELELGLLLLILPWSSAWRHNHFVAVGTLFWRWWISPYLRGAVSGLGLLNLWYGTEAVTGGRS